MNKNVFLARRGLRKSKRSARRKRVALELKESQENKPGQTYPSKYSRLKRWIRDQKKKLKQVKQEEKEKDRDEDILDALDEQRDRKRSQDKMSE